MARADNQKLKLLYLARYLERSTDDEHPVTVQQMIDYLDHQGIAAARKTLYDDMESLRHFGLDVQSVRKGSSTGYFIGAREFELPELKLLVDSVQASRSITHKRSLSLIRKLEHLTSEHNAGQLHRQVWVRGRIKTMNESIYYNVDDVHAAIEENVSITFQYYEWNVRRERVFRRDGKRYAVSPWALLWDDENYYMIAYDHEAGFLKHFRVDKLSGIRRMKTPRLGGEEFRKLDMAAYSNTHFGMFSGEVQKVRLCFDNRLAGPVIDRFGTETALVPYDEEHFSVTVNAAVNVQFFGWLCGFGDRVRILSPADAAEKMHEHVASIARLYEAQT